jgi:hypothetical protein
MTTITGQVTVTDAQGNASSVPIQFEVADGSPSTGGDHEVTGFQPNGFTVPAGEVWEVRGLVETPKNVVVEGTLRMRPGATLRFVGVNELAFVGGGMEPLATDVGLWVMGDGVLDAQGTPKVAWNRSGSDGSWLAGDELVLAPSAHGDYGSAGFASYRGGAVPQAHASVPATEVLNLTRDVAIEGTSGGRTHVFIHSMQPQTIRHVAVRYVGPRKNGKKVLGRWGVHLHHMDDASRGSMIEGVVVRDAGSHAFVPHMSHGVTFRNCIAYNVQEDAYWWDPRTTSKPDPSDSFTDDATFDHCVAALVKAGDEPNGLRLSGFNVSEGTVDFSNRLLGCVAVGVQGNRNSAGFGWQESQQGAVWVIQDCVAHNNSQDGAFIWWNTPSGRVNTTTRFTAYRCGNAGIELGAYMGVWNHEAPLLVGNAQSGVLQHARSLNANERIRYTSPIVVGEGVTKVAFQEGEPVFFDNPPVIVCAASVDGCGALVDESRHPTTTFEFNHSC